MIKALGKRIVVELVDLQTEKKGLLIVPNQSENITAVVRALGSDVDASIEIGDIIYIGKRDGVEVSINGQKLLSVHESSVLAAWKDK